MSVLLFIGVLYQGNSISLLNLEKQRLERDIAHFNKEATALRASLSNHQQEKSSLEAQLQQAKIKTSTAETSLARAQGLRESLQSEIREINAQLRECDRNAKKREEELEADVAKVTQERNDLKIQVDTESSMSATWAQKLAEEQRAKAECYEHLKWLTTPEATTTTENTNSEEIIVTEDIDLGRKGAEEIKDDVIVEVIRDDTGSSQKHRMDLER